MDCNTPGRSICLQFLELAQTHIHCVGDAIQPPHPLSSLCPPAFSLSQHQCLPTGSISLLSKGLSRVFSSTIVWKCQFFSTRPSLWSQLSHLYMTTGKTIALTRWKFISKILSLLFNMLSRFLILFLPSSKCLLISWLQSPSAVILEPRKIKVSHCFHCFPIYFPWSDGTRCHDIRFLNV